MNITNWFRTEKDGIHIHKSLNIEQTGIVQHGFSGRVGGVGKAPYESLNLALHVGEGPESVLENRRLFARAMELNPEKIVSADQPHDNKTAVITAEDAGKGALDFGSALKGIDALITNVPGPVLALHYADCTPVFLVDPVKKAAGVVHAGWKGTTINVTGAAVAAMVENFGSNPADIQAAIGPAISRCCFEIQKDVAELLLAAADGDDRVISNHGGEGDMHGDVKLVNWLQLRRAGVPDENISVSQECTCCNAAEFFSYRRDSQTGRMTAWIALT